MTETNPPLSTRRVQLGHETLYHEATNRNQCAGVEEGKQPATPDYHRISTYLILRP